MIWSWKIFSIFNFSGHAPDKISCFLQSPNKRTDVVIKIGTRNIFLKAQCSCTESSPYKACTTACIAVGSKLSKVKALLSYDDEENQEKEEEEDLCLWCFWVNFHINAMIIQKARTLILHQKLLIHSILRG